MDSLKYESLNIFANGGQTHHVIGNHTTMRPSVSLQGMSPDPSGGMSPASLTRVSAEEMDEIRQQNIAYEYLCHLEEAKKWIETCLCEELPPASECEENIRNGVYLAKLSNFFCPEKVPFKKIYDKDQCKYHASGLQFRHTDNINHFFNALEYIGLPKIFIPETTDIYDKKNMPRVVYCLHALSLYLFKLGIAPQIQDLYGVAKFTEEEITTMARELKKYGLQLPPFSKIGGILANEMPIDEAALHAAILAINDAIEKKYMEAMLASLRLHDAHLLGVIDDYIQHYHRCMHEAKLTKSSQAQRRSSDQEDYVADVYDELLTQSEIQSLINKINAERLTTEISLAIEAQNSELLLRLLKSKYLPLKNVTEKNIEWYLLQLTEEKNALSQNFGFVWSEEIIQAAINLANTNAEKHNKYLKLADSLNNCLLNNQKDEFMQIMLANRDVFAVELDYDYALALIFIEFKSRHDEDNSSNIIRALSLDEFVRGTHLLLLVIEINKTLDTAATLSTYSDFSANPLFIKESENLHRQLAQLADHFRADNKLRSEGFFKRRYLSSLIQFRQQKINSSANNSYSINALENLSESKNGSLSDSGHSETSFTVACHLLTQAEIQDCVTQTNADYEQECLTASLINDSLCKETNIPHILYLLKSAAIWRGGDENNNKSTNVIEQNGYLYLNELKQLIEIKGVLNMNEIRAVVRSCNGILENALIMSKTMLMINQIDESEQKEILSLLRSQSLGIVLNKDQPCEQFYYETIRELKRSSRSQQQLIKSGSEYFWNKTAENYDFYLNLKDPSVYSWTKPVEFESSSHLLTRTSLKRAVDLATENYERTQLYISNEDTIVRLQAVVRGFLTRRSFKSRVEFYEHNLDTIVKIQSWWRMIKQRNAFESKKKLFKANISSIVLMQSVIRMWLQKRKFQQRIEYLHSNEEAIIRLQSHVRTMNARKDFISLMNDKDPSLKTVSKFIYLLEHNNADFTEEIELQELRRQVITTIKMNKNLEQDLDMMDVKIGLLVKNRITLQDVLAQHKKLKKYKEDIESSQTSQIKQLSKENHDKMELYQNLFYLLQTNPVYLAKLLYILPASNSSKFIETVVLQLFNYGANSREEYLLLKLLTTALQTEIESKVDKVSDIITNTPLVVKVIVSLYRKHRGENVLRNLLNPTTEEFLQAKGLQLCLSPAEIYKSWVNRLETETGVPSGFAYDVSNQKALEYEEVRKQLEANIKAVKMYTAKFLNLIIKSLNKLPYGLRYIARVLRASLKAKFPASSDREILKIIGNLIYYRFLNSAICSPDMYDIVDMKAGDSLDLDQRKNLACIAKHLQLISMSKGYGDTENAHLSCLNPFIKESHELIRNYFQEACNVAESDDYFGINEYSDLIVLTKPIIYMTVQEIRETHKILYENMEKIAPNEADPLREILTLLGVEPSLNSLGENLVSRSSLNSQASNAVNKNNGSVDSSSSLSNNNQNSTSNLSKNTQLCLTLTNRFTPSGDEKLDLNNLLIKTKRLIIEIIHCQSAENLTELLNQPTIAEQERMHKKLLVNRENYDKQHSKHLENQRVSKLLSFSLDEMKQQVRKNLAELEKAKLVSSADRYQLIVSRIAQDLRNQRKHRQRRQKELAHLQEVYRVLQKKNNLLKEQVGYYNEYVKVCLDRYNNKKKSKNPFKRNKLEKVAGSVKYTAAKLHEKGVILEIEGLQTSQFKSVVFEISTTEEPGVFDVTAEFMGVTMDKVELEFQDLLQMQYEGVAIMRMFDKAKINVNLLIFLINKKFYSKSK